MTTANYAAALEELRKLLASCKAKSGLFHEMNEARDQVFAVYQPIFSPEHIPKLTKEEFKSFLVLDNNKHWSGLHRQGSRICANMKALRKALTGLLDESQDLAKRLNLAVDAVKGMGKNIVTAILFMAYPDKYGVWNNKSEAVMQELGLWPEFDRGTSFGQKYAVLNTLLNRLKNDLGTDLWTLDSLWHYFLLAREEGPGQEETGEEKDGAQRFGLERHLHEFLRDNWDKTQLGKEWALYSEQGDPEAGYEYPCPVGRIDLLARSRNAKKPRWLVIELKRSQSSDDTVGQVLRYMGYVQEHLAKGELVGGLVIAHEADDKLRYALKATANVKLMLYEVEFRLRQDEKDQKPR